MLLALRITYWGEIHWEKVTIVFKNFGPFSNKNFSRTKFSPTIVFIRQTIFCKGLVIRIKAAFYTLQPGFLHSVSLSTC